jgi:Glycosyl transferases group 1
MIAVLSDVPLGYGSPQIVRLASCLGRLLDQQVLIIAPKGDDAAGRLVAHSGVKLLEIDPGESISLPIGQMVYAQLVARELNALKPDYIVLCAFLAAPAILLMHHKPKHLIYYGYEHTDGHMRAIERIFQQIGPQFDLAIFPEANRAVLDASRLALGLTPILILLNVVAPLCPPVPFDQRNRRACYAGLLSPERTRSDALLGGMFDDVPLDVWGRFEGHKAPGRLVDDLVARNSQVRLHGHVPADTRFHQAIAQASVSLVCWMPDSESTFYACPNKFFEAIALGVPVVIGPHAQAAQIIARWGCGVLAPSFEISALHETLVRTLDQSGTAAYEALVSNCLKARDQSLNPEMQETRLARALRSIGLAV